MAGHGARAKRCAKRELTKGVKVELVLKIDGVEHLSCGHIGPDIPLDWHPPLRCGRIIRRCLQCKPHIILFRPVGPREMRLIQESEYRAFPARLPGQPIFYPVCNQQYAEEIAERWNKKEYGVGYVTRFSVRPDFLLNYEKHCVGAKHHEEYWIPAEDLDDFNKAIIGKIVAIKIFKGLEEI